MLETVLQVSSPTVTATHPGDMDPGNGERAVTAARRSESGAALRGLLVFLVVISIAVLGVGYTFGYVVAPGEMGVRQIKFGPYQGFSETALEPGYHWSIPFYSTIHFIPQTLQVLALNSGSTDEQESGAALEIQTEDGSSVYVDASVLFQYYPDTGAAEHAHGGPRDLITKLGADSRRWRAQIESDASNRLKFKLGTLTTSDFYDPVKRQDKIDKALEEIKERSKGYGIKVEGLLIQRYRYTEEIDTAIFQKNLQEQEGSLNKAKSRLAAASAILKDVTAREDARIKNLKVESENKARVIRSEGDLYEAKKRAEGDLSVAQARAEVDKLRAAALASSSGAAVYVGKELAPLLGSLKGGVVSNVDPYNLDQWMDRLGAGAK